MSDAAQPLLDIREQEDFKNDERDVKAALIAARRFAQETDASKPFASDPEAEDAADAIKAMKRLRTLAEDHRKEILAPHEETKRHVNGHYKELLSPVNAAIDVLTKRGLAFKRERERKEAEEERRRREALQKQEEEAAQKAQEAAEKAEAEPENPDAQKEAGEAHRIAANAAMATQQRQGEDAKPKQIRGAFGSLGSVTDYKWEVVDLAALPDEHTTFNKKTIDAAVKGEKAMAKAQGREFNLRLIPGVRIWPEERGVSR
jgi:colicin import membrane protein